MAHSLSAKKRVRQNAKRRQLNRARKSMVRTAIKKFELAVRNHEVQEAEQYFLSVQKRLDKVAAKGTMHKNTASRTKARMAKKLQDLRVKEQAG
ncbi:30S ribosomal protein S20 [Sedimentisphaera salicampi]|uniref:Small ribosomal subunit protein bS20 n=1 Tax=Sedimentisphaera salicampi TaxID=1941349 RepID=A0A1W6LPN1_9BACT|nr:30S ribosomal protein S20 [Sedimentisphaera salicampi]ARN57758.1 30S ribosomal protein S20 [Sedimentisphaera salicampi]OXU14316.1 30S ribosomal protein S20 [Sedimentisphaera salicampi]